MLKRIETIWYCSWNIPGTFEVHSIHEILRFLVFEVPGTFQEQNWTEMLFLEHSENKMTFFFYDQGNDGYAHGIDIGGGGHVGT